MQVGNFLGVGFTYHSFTLGSLSGYVKLPSFNLLIYSVPAIYHCMIRDSEDKAQDDEALRFGIPHWLRGDVLFEPETEAL